MNKIWALSLLVVSSVLTTAVTVSAPVNAQAQQNQQQGIIADIRVQGNVRIEAATIVSYLTVTIGDRFDNVALDNSLKRLFSTGLFNDVDLIRQGNILIINVIESPIINRIIFEGNKKLDREDLLEEITMGPRDIFTRARVRAEVARILDLYRQKGRFAAIVEPKVVQRSQNRVDVVFEIQEGPKTKVSKINFMGNKAFSDGDLRDVLVTKESRWWKIFSSGDTFDPDKLLYDQQELRNFYLNEGYADFRIVSSVAELTADRKNFIINYTVEEGEIYKFGKMTVESEIRDVNAEFFKNFLVAREGNRFSQEAIEKSQENLTELAGAQGYAFLDVRANPRQNRDTKTIDFTFNILEAPRVYVDRINIRGNIRTLDKIIRREFRLQEGDAFNSLLIKRSEQRLNRLGFFREGSVEVSYNPTSTRDRTVVDVSVEETSTGDLNFGVGFSSVENFIFNFSINERNFMGKGQRLGFSLNLSGQSKSANVSFTEPYFLNRNIAAGGDLFVRQTDNTRFGGLFNSESYGFSLRAGAALGEYWTLQTNYTLRFDNVYSTEPGLDQALGLSYYDYLSRDLVYYTDEELEAIYSTPEALAEILERRDWTIAEKEDYVYGQFTDPIYASSFGKFTQSIVGYTFGFDTRNNYLRPTAGRAFYFSQNFAGLGGDVKYLRSSLNFDNYWTPIDGWTLRTSLQAGHIVGVGQNVRLSDSFYLGGPQLRGFDVNGVGPRRFTRYLSNNLPGEFEPSFTTADDGTINFADPSFSLGSIVAQHDLDRSFGQALGGTKQYIGRTELFFPLGDAALEMGINASAFIDVGSLWDTDVNLPKCEFGGGYVESYQSNYANYRTYYNNIITAKAAGRRLDEEIRSYDFGQNADCVLGDSWKPRATIGIGFSWQSPFGPFRIDLTKPLRSNFGDNTKSLQFNIGTTF